MTDNSDILLHGPPRNEMQIVKRNRLLNCLCELKSEASAYTRIAEEAIELAKAFVAANANAGEVKNKDAVAANWHGYGEGIAWALAEVMTCLGITEEELREATQP